MWRLPLYRPVKEEFLPRGRVRVKQILSVMPFGTTVDDLTVDENEFSTSEKELLIAVSSKLFFLFRNKADLRDTYVHPLLAQVLDMISSRL